MVYFLNSFMFILLTTIYFSCHTLADWLLPPFRQPQQPESNTRLRCHKWILLYEFEEASTVNRERARGRRKEFDVHVSEFAVLYAHVLVAFPNTGENHSTENLTYLTRYTPWKYCKKIGMQSAEYNFVTFGATQKTCEEWIYPYRYKVDNKKKNLKYAKSRDKNEDGNISLWAAVYAQYITKKETISVPEFCSGMGLSSIPMLFMSLKGTTKSCHEWILLSEYGTNVDNNTLKAKLQRKRFYKYINVPTRLYIEYLLSFVPKKKLFGWAGASSSSSASVEGPKEPAEFCEDGRMYAEVPITYFGDRMD